MEAIKNLITPISKLKLVGEQGLCEILQSLMERWLGTRILKSLIEKNDFVKQKPSIFKC